MPFGCCKRKRKNTKSYCKIFWIFKVQLEWYVTIIAFFSVKGNISYKIVFFAGCQILKVFYLNF